MTEENQSTQQKTNDFFAKYKGSSTDPAFLGDIDRQLTVTQNDISTNDLELATVMHDERMAMDNIKTWNTALDRVRARKAMILATQVSAREHEKTLKNERDRLMAAMVEEV